MLDSETFENCWTTIKTLAPQSLSWNHYDLAVKTKINDPQIWKEFLTDENVSEWLEEERKIMQATELAKLTANISSSRSVGQAQLISALDRLQSNKSDQTATGPAFIYTYVPLNNEQKEAPNVQLLQEDIFYVNPINSTGPKFNDTETSPISN
jgi:hypothetical protein